MDNNEIILQTNNLKDKKVKIQFVFHLQNYDKQNNSFRFENTV